MPAVKNSRIVVTAFGGPEVLKYIEEALPEPGQAEVRVKVLAAGVAYADVLMRRGFYPGTPPLPFTPGYDLVGEIDALGKDVTQFALGQRVGALTVRGACEDDYDEKRIDSPVCCHWALRGACWHAGLMSRLICYRAVWVQVMR